MQSIVMKVDKVKDIISCIYPHFLDTDAFNVFSLVVPELIPEISDFIQDNNFTELKEAELMKERLELLGQVDPYTGRYYSQAWIQRNVLRMTDDEIDLMDKQIKDSLATNVAFAQNKGEQQLAQQQPTMEFQQDQQQAMAQQQQAAEQEGAAQQQADKSEQAAKKPEGKKKPTGEQKDSFDWNN